MCLIITTTRLRKNKENVFIQFEEQEDKKVYFICKIVQFVSCELCLLHAWCVLEGSEINCVYTKGDTSRDLLIHISYLVGQSGQEQYQYV